MMIMIKNLIGDHFCEDAQGRDGHGHAIKSKETLQLNILMMIRDEYQNDINRFIDYELP